MQPYTRQLYTVGTPCLHGTVSNASSTQTTYPSRCTLGTHINTASTAYAPSPLSWKGATGSQQTAPHPTFLYLPPHDALPAVPPSSLVPIAPVTWLTPHTARSRCSHRPFLRPRAATPPPPWPAWLPTRCNTATGPSGPGRGAGTGAWQPLAHTSSAPRPPAAPPGRCSWTGWRGSAGAPARPGGDRVQLPEVLQRKKSRLLHRPGPGPGRRMRMRS